VVIAVAIKPEVSMTESFVLYSVMTLVT